MICGCQIIGLADFAPVTQGLSTTMARKSLTLVKVGPGRRRPPARSKKPGRIVVGKKRGRIEAEFPRARSRVTVDDARPRGPRPSRPRRRCRRYRPRAPRCRPFRRASIASASAYSWFGPPRPLPADRDGQFATRQDHGTAARGLQFARQPRVLGRDLARLAFEPLAEKDDLVAGSRDRRVGGSEAHPRAARSDGIRVWRKLRRPASGFRCRDRRARARPRRAGRA